MKTFTRRSLLSAGAAALAAPSLALASRDRHAEIRRTAAAFLRALDDHKSIEAEMDAVVAAAEYEFNPVTRIRVLTLESWDRVTAFEDRHFTPSGERLDAARDDFHAAMKQAGYLAAIFDGTLYVSRFAETINDHADVAFRADRILNLDA